MIRPLQLRFFDFSIKTSQVGYGTCECGIDTKDFWVEARPSAAKIFPIPHRRALPRNKITTEVKGGQRPRERGAEAEAEAEAEADMGWTETVRKAEKLVEEAMRGNDASHDAAHVWRVRDLALSLAREEGLSSDPHSMQIVNPPAPPTLFNSLSHSLFSSRYGKKKKKMDAFSLFSFVGTSFYAFTDWFRRKSNEALQKLSTSMFLTLYSSFASLVLDKNWCLRSTPSGFWLVAARKCRYFGLLFVRLFIFYNFFFFFLKRSVRH